MPQISTFPISTVTATASRVANIATDPIVATNVQDAIDELAVLALGAEVRLSTFGVTGDGSTDDTAAINAAFASLDGGSGTVVWDVGFCKVTDTILVGSATTQTNVNIFCPNGPIHSGVKWFGSTSGTAVLFSKQKFARCIGLGIFNQVAKGTTIGLGLGGAGGGNQTSGIIFDGLFVSGFATGAQAGHSGGAASEIALNMPVFQSCDIGWTSIDFNSLDFTFINVGLDACGIGIETGASSGFDVFGGSASNSSVADFKIGSNSLQTYIGGGFRSEVATICVLGAGGGDVTLERVYAVSPPSPFNAISGSFGTLTVRECVLEGFISLGVVNKVEVVGCTLTRWDTTRKLPVILPTDEQHLRTRGMFRDNLDAGSPAARIDDHQGIFGGRYDGVSTVTAFYEPCITVIPIDRASTTALGCDYLALSHVRHLGEGTIPGATAGTAPTTGKNLRVRGIFATSATLSHAFTRTNVVVTADNTPVVTATTGTFNQSDVGKKLKITGGADTGGDWYGYVARYLTSTTVEVAPSEDGAPGARNPHTFGVNKNTIIGEDEPDANYMVVGLVGSADENFWIDHTTIATTGFSFKSSNASSTATVTALIVR